MLNSYNKSNGALAIIIVIGSGVGVTIAITVKIITMAYRLYFLRNALFTIPIRESRSISTGIWKTIPIPKTNIISTSMYETSVIMFSTSEDTEKVTKNLNAMGNTKMYPTVTPANKSIDENQNALVAVERSLS
jgi:hypothetical protein